MDKKKAALGTGIMFGALFAGLTYNFGRMMYNGTFGEKPKVGKEKFEEHYKSLGYLQRLKEFKQQKFMVENSKNGYLIETLHLKSNMPSPNVMVIVHGVTSNYYDLLPVAFRYLDEGTNVIMYNQRHTGDTGGKNYTFGLFERFDLEEIATIAKRLYPRGWVGIHGFSMGAATAAMHSELNETTKTADFYILDCPFQSMESVLDAAFQKRNYPGMVYPYLKWSGNLTSRLRARIKYGDIKPIEAVSRASVPILILHGTDDRTCPFVGAKLMYEAIPHKKKEFHAFEGLDHCEAHFLKTEEYFGIIWKFIEKKCLKSADKAHNLM